MNDLGRMLIGLGLLIAAAGAAILLLGRFGLPLGRLPGDLTWRGKHTTVYFPLVTCIVLSAVLSLLFWLLGKFWR
jgi:multisubunit Na+/H+ antiporter MnhC subunit